MVVVLMLLALLGIGRLLAAYPLQTSYTLKGLDAGASLEPRFVRACIFAGVTALIILGFQIFLGEGMNLFTLLPIVGLNLASRMLLDYAKTSPSIFGKYKVASEYEMDDVASDYKSPDAAVVAAARVISESNKMFWWCNGLVVCAFGLMDLVFVYLLK